MPNYFLRNLVLTLAVLGLAIPSAFATTLTRTSAFTYDEGSGLLKKEIIEPGSSELCLVTEYDYDGYGNKKSATTRNCDASAIPGIGNEAAAPAAGSDAVIASRTTSTDYAAGTGWAAGQFPTKSTNALGQFETKTYDAKFGAVLSLTGPNGLPTTWQYDGFGRKTLETRADGTQTRWEYKYCISISGGTENCPTIGGAAGAWVLITTPLASDGSTVIGPIGKTYYDGLNREIRQESQGFDGTGTSKAVYQDTRYDSLGRAYQKSRPYYADQTACPGTEPPEPACWTTLTYDSLGRVLEENRPDETTANGAVTRYAYNGLSVIVTNSKGQTRTTKKNSQGQVVEVIDNVGKKLSFTYDAFGNLTETIDDLGNKTTLTYDLRGRKKTMQDPDMGTWTYAYNALGQLIRQTDAKAQESSMTYDLLGRMTQRTEADLISVWRYDTGKNGAACPKGVGKLCQAELVDSQGNNAGYTRVHGYDDVGRPSSTSTTVDTATYTTSVSYYSGSVTDRLAQGRVKTQTYPGGLVVYYGYTAKGYLKELRKDDGNGALYWQATEQDAEGRLREQKFGNDVVTTHTYAASSGRLTRILAGAGSVQDLTYEYDSLGNVTHRTDLHPNLTTPSGNVTVGETFLYDTLNRLESSTVTSSAGSTTIGSIAKTYTYDALGNLTSRSDVSVSAENSGYLYQSVGTNGVRPHAVSRVNLIGGGHRTYAYDANGNLAQSRQYSDAVSDEAYRVKGGGRTAYFTSFNMPSVIHDDHDTNVRLELSLYGPEHQRLKGSVTKPVGTGPEVVSRTTIYLHPDNSGGLAFEKETQFDGTDEERNFITAGGQVVAVVKRINGAWAPPQYFHRDNLGSTTAITDDSGAVIERLAYEPFGKRRFSDGITAGTDDTGNTIVPLNTTRGFTNHEHIDELGIVHMNGRIYDPAIGRFMSADSHVQSPENLQSFNRYAYALNNPLMYTDPSGYFNVARFVARAIAAVADAFGCSGYCSAAVAAYQGYQQGGAQGAIVSVVSQQYGPNSVEAFAARTVMKCSNGGGIRCVGDSAIQQIKSDLRAELLATIFPRPGPAMCQGLVEGDSCDQGYGPGVSHLGPLVVGVGTVIVEGTVIRSAGVWAVRGLALALPESVRRAIGVMNEAQNGEEGEEGADSPDSSKPPLSDYKDALDKVHAEVGKLPKGEDGKFGSPQRGDSKKGYRLDPPHDGAAQGDAESKRHINWWDYTGGKRGRGGRSGAIPIGD